MIARPTDLRTTIREFADVFGQIFLPTYDSFTFGRYSADHHTLATATHEARAERYGKRFEPVTHLAEKQVVWIDANALHYEPSLAPCPVQQSPDLYTLSARQARTNKSLLSLAVGSIEIA